MNLIQKRNSR